VTARRRVAALAPEIPAAELDREASAAPVRRVTRLRAAIHAACVLAGLASAGLCVPALRLPSPAGPVHGLAAVVVVSAMTATLLAPGRTRPAAPEGADS
jgi:hypothetical protein